MSLEDFECLHYRDLLRAGRYAALADAEGFDQICFALEALGMHLLGRQATMGPYERAIARIAVRSPVLSELASIHPAIFNSFRSLYAIVKKARNDNMHTGAYARHAAAAAMELCIGLEEALMTEVEQTVGSVMVKAPITVQPWHLVGHARQLMLMHSFSFLPVFLDGNWHLLSELHLAKFLLGTSINERQRRLGLSIKSAHGNGDESAPQLGLSLVAEGRLLTSCMAVEAVVERTSAIDGPTLWLVPYTGNPGSLFGVLSPFELM